MNNPISRLNKFVALTWFISSVAGVFLATYSATPELTHVGKLLLVFSAGYMMFGLGIKKRQDSINGITKSGNNTEEAHITINGHTLTSAQSAAIRVAIDSFDSELQVDGLGNDAHGSAMSVAYGERISEIRSALYK